MLGALAGFAAFLGLMLLVLAVPVAVEFRLQRNTACRGQFTVRWLFGLVRKRFPWPADNAPAAPDAQGRKPSRVGRAANSGREHLTRAHQVLRDAAFRRRLVRLAKDLAKALHLRRLSLRARLGLGDPADTGRLWALVGPLNACARDIAHIDVEIEPAFVDPTLEFDLQGGCLIVPLQFLALAMAFMLSPATIRVWHSARAVNG